VPKRRKSTEIELDLTEIQRSVTEVAELDDPTEEDIARSDAALDSFETLQQELAEAVAYEERVEVVRSASFLETAAEPASGPTQIQRARRGPEVVVKSDPFDILRSNNAHMDKAEITRALTDANLAAMEPFEKPKGYTGSFETMIKRHAKDTSWATNMLARMSPAYISAFEKVTTGDTAGLTLTEVERSAIAVGTNTAGGYLVPTQLDPTLIMTNSGAKDVIRGISREVTLTGGANKWNGVTTAGATASWDAELTEVSDDTPPVAPAQVPVYSAKALIMASIEAFEDITGLTSDVQMLLADARTRLEAAAHMNGNGTGQPTGIFPALSGNGAVTISLATGHTWTLADIQKMANALGDRWTDDASWVMHPNFRARRDVHHRPDPALYPADLGPQGGPVVHGAVHLADDHDRQPRRVR
jgi:HK97 family phage major capsid protein